ncbi:MAG: prolyl oligopeptidase family serine peptidase [Pyrinomonadaceae bacterium]
MKRIGRTALAVILVAGAFTPRAAAQNLLSRPASPPAPVREVTDDYFGTKVVDPYRWMEDMGSAELRDWMKTQADYARAALDRVPARGELLERTIALGESATARVSDVRRLPGERYFYLKTLAKENTAKLYAREGLAGRETLLVDPEKMSAGAARHVSISYFEPSWDGKLVAVGLAAGGSENTVIRVFETDTGRETGETIDRARYGGVSWRPDHRSFFYTRLQKLAPGAPITELQQKARVYLHTIGTDAARDEVVFGHEVFPEITIEPALHPYLVTSPASRFALAWVVSGVGGASTVYAAPLSSIGKPGTPWLKVCGPEDETTQAVAHGDDLYAVTAKGAPRYKVVRTSLSRPDLARAATVVPAGEAVVGGRFAGFGALHVAEDALYVEQLDGGLGRVLRVPFAGKSNPERVALPFDGALQGLSADPRLPGVFVRLTSWVKAPAVYAYDPRAKRFADTSLQPRGPLDEPADVEAVEVKVKAADGTLVPLSIIHKRGLKLDGSNPTLIHGYGSYGISQLPFFNPQLLAWYERGGVYAVAHVRGGGEYGEEWHRAGQKGTKSNTWRDFISCAEYLVEQRYTTPARLAGMGQSAGGILIGRAVTERPDLFGAAVISVGLTDMLRYETTANGVPNVPEFGSVRTPEGFKALHEMSAYHHVKDGTAYPAVLVTTGINDPRVEPWLPAKMAARLQAATSSGRPVLLRIDYNAGHGVGSTRRQFAEELADIMTFLLWQFGDPAFRSPRQT